MSEKLRCIYDETIRKFVLIPINIYYNKKHYEIRKRINKKLSYWGRFTNIKDALHELKILKKVNWDIDLLVEI